MADTKYISSISKFGEDYEVRDARIDSLETPTATLNTLKNVDLTATEAGDILVMGSDGYFASSDDYLQPSEVLDSQGKLISSVIPADMMTKSYLLDNVGEEDEAIKDQYIPAGMMTKAYLLEDVGKPTERIKDDYIPSGMMNKEDFLDKDGAGSYTTFKEAYLPSSLITESELLDDDDYIRTGFYDPSGVVTSVNNVAPTGGNVDVTHVELADNLYNADNSADTGSFMLRTSGGEANLSTGDAFLSKIDGHSYNANRTEDTYEINAASTLKDGASITVKRIKLRDDIVEGNNTFTYDGSKWTFGGEQVSLSTYGITEPTLIAEVHTLTASPAEATTECDLKASWGEDDVGLATWKAHALAATKSNYVFTYDGNQTSGHKPWYISGKTESAYTSISTAELTSVFGIYAKSSSGTDPILPSATFAGVISEASTGITGITTDIDKYHATTIESLYTRGSSKTFIICYSPNITYRNKWCYSFETTVTETTTWTEIPDQNLELVGITAVEGTPAQYDIVTLTYTAPSSVSITLSWTPASTGTLIVTYTKGVQGTIKNVKPYSFNATSLNIYDKDTMSLDNYTIAPRETGSTEYTIQASADKTIAFVRVCGDVSNTSGIYGYNVKLFNTTTEEAVSTSIDDPETHIAGIYYSGTLKTTAGSVIETKLEQLDKTLFADVEDIGYIWKNPSEGLKYIYANHGLIEGYLYVVIDTSVKENLCIHPIWSGPRDSYFAPYELSTIAINTLKGSTDGGSTLVDIPCATYGMPAVGSVKDELNLDQAKYIKKVNAVAYTDQASFNSAIAAAKAYCLANNTSYDFDDFTESGGSGYVYTELVSSDYVSYSLYIGSTPATQSFSKYTVNDMGHEYYIFHDADHAFAVPTTIVYGKNLKDRLRVDVLTMSGDTIGDDTSKLDLLKEKFGIDTLETSVTKLLTYNYTRSNHDSSEVTKTAEETEDKTITLSSNYETVIDGNCAESFNVKLIAPTSADMTEGKYNKAFEWRLLFTCTADDVTLTLSTDDADSSYTFLNDDGAATEIECEKDNFYEISFALLTGKYIGVAVKEWPVPSSAS